MRKIANTLLLGCFLIVNVAGKTKWHLLPLVFVLLTVLFMVVNLFLG